MRATSTFASLLRQGRMEYQWYYYSSDVAQPLASDFTSIPKISTVIGSSTWHVDGDWQHSPDSYNDSVLLWSGVCDFFYEKMFDFKSKQKGVSNRDGMSYAPLYDFYLIRRPENEEFDKSDFRKVLAIGVFLNFFIILTITIIMNGLGIIQSNIEQMKIKTHCQAFLFR